MRTKANVTLTQSQLRLINKVINRLGMYWLTRKVYINYVPTVVTNNAKATIVGYRQAVIKQWDQIEDNQGRLFVKLYNANDYTPIADLIGNNNKVWMMDVEPLVTYFDVAKCCNEVNLNPSVFYQYCQQYKQYMAWLPNVTISINKVFDKRYPNQLYQMLQQWVLADKQ